MQRELLTLAEMANTGNKWAVIAINETGFYRADIIKKAGRVDGIYLVELDKPTCLCSPAINYPTTLIKNYLHNIEGFTEDKIWELEMDQTLAEWRYYSEGFKCEKVKYYGSEYSIEEILENEAANPSVC